MPDQITLSYFIIWRVWKEPAVLCSLYCNNTCAILAMLALPCVHTWDCMCVRACVNECVCVHTCLKHTVLFRVLQLLFLSLYITFFLSFCVCFLFPSFFILLFPFFFLFFFFLYLLPVLLALVPNAPPTSVTSRLALSNPISCWWRGWMRRW